MAKLYSTRSRGTRNWPTKDQNFLYHDRAALVTATLSFASNFVLAILKVPREHSIQNNQNLDLWFIENFIAFKIQTGPSMRYGIK